MIRADGCSYHDTCLTCPLIVCRDEHPDHLRGAIRATREAQERAAFLEAARHRKSLIVVWPPVFQSVCIMALCVGEGVTIAMLRGRDRDRDLADARHRVVRRMSDELGMTTSAIARFLHRDHSTIHWSLGDRPRARSTA